MPDGSVILVEIAAGKLTRVVSDGSKELVADLGGGPNGAAIGPDGRCYVCNNGGFEWRQLGPYLLPGEQAADYETGSIQVVDLETGGYETLYAECDGHRLCGPNDIVFDATGGFWFTDHGKTRERDRDRGGLYYAKADGSEVREVVYPLEAPNGVGLSPQGDRVYVAETTAGQLLWWSVARPGEIVANPASPNGGHFCARPAGRKLFDSLAVDAEGKVCVATIATGGISVFAPDGSELPFVVTDDPLTTNICFGGDDLQTAYITLSGTGCLVSTRWDRPGLVLAY